MPKPPQEAAARQVPQRALCALRLHSKLVHLLLDKLDLPWSLLQELRLACARGRSKSTGRGNSEDEQASTWTLSASGVLYVIQELRCPLWHRLWSVVGAKIGQENLDAMAAGCMSSRELDIITEVEVHVSAALRHLGHASSHLHEVGELFSADLRGDGKKGNAEAQWEDASTAEDGSVAAEGGRAFPTYGTTPKDSSMSPKAIPPISSFESQISLDDSDKLGPSFATCQSTFGEAIWTFFVHLQLVSALFRGDVLLLCAWSLRLLGLPGPWSLRRLQEFVVGTLELLVERPDGLSKEPPSQEALRFFWDACATYLTAPVIPRLQTRLKNSVAALRKSGVLRQEVVGDGSKRLQQSIAAILGETSVEGNFDGTGNALEAFRASDELHEAFQRAMREAVVARVDRGCPLDVRNHTLKSFEALSAPPLLRKPMSEAKRKELLQALASVPQHDRIKARPMAKSWDNRENENPQDRRKALRDSSLDEELILGLEDVRPRISQQGLLKASAGFPFCCTADSKVYDHEMK